ncbi:MAG: tRNA uridine-5-carboxymethylaminomethyl(34) synthesis GTPase MnmE [Actinomycetota bacterium]|nr:tRNA uridine-5-carboxymethylaminomethyl(34) synthesis GTPase MnmE [Actinomycetota bacterium]
MNSKDTIVAVGTRPGEAAIGIVKLSGRNSINIADKIFRAKNSSKIKELETYSMVYGHIVDKGSIIDEVVVSLMKNPKSYTKEDVVEINCHGGMIPVGKVMELCVEKGARIAEPGEFTKRAFLSGRIDLSQAESVIDIVRSRTEESLKIAAKNLQGNVKNNIEKLRNRILDVMAQLEASVDFVEEDLEITPYNKLEMDVIKIKEELVEIIDDEKRGEIIKNGVKVAIVGKPNVGKSSLLNYLLGNDKAIVTSIPGTTRDAVEEVIYVEGIPLILVDTAGIRKTKNAIEKIGVGKSIEHIDEAELIIMVMDGNGKLEKTDMEIIKKIKNKTSICCVNKIDLELKIDIGKIKNFFKYGNIIKISALKGTGIKRLEDIIRKTALNGGDINLEEKVIVNKRQMNILKKVKSTLDKAERAMAERMSEEFPSYDLKEAYTMLGEIIGKTVRDDILEKIFGQFCVGK